MYFLLGAFSAGLLSLLVLPAFWRRAMRLSRQRLEGLTPLSMEEAMAERDLLRAEFASEQRRLEQKMEAQAGNRAEIMAELGRRTVELAAVEEKFFLLQSAHNALTRDHGEAIRARNEAEGQLGALLLETHAATSLNHRFRADYFDLSQQHQALAQLEAERRVTIGALEARIAGLDAQCEGFSLEIAELQRVLRNTQEQARGLGEERDMLLKELHALEKRMALALERLDAERRRAESLQQSLNASMDETRGVSIALKDTQISLTASQAAHNLAQSSIADLQSQIEEIQRAMRKQNEDAHAADKAAADYILALKEEIASLSDALALLRCGQEASSVLDLRDADAASLRQAIVAIGHRAAQMADKTPL